MTRFDIDHTFEVPTDDELAPEPNLESQPISNELLGELLTHIEFLWKQHAQAIRTQSPGEREETQTNLLRAYRQLENLREYLWNDKAFAHINPEIIDHARQELDFSRQTFHKVIK